MNKHDVSLHDFRFKRLKGDGRFVIEEKAVFAPFGLRLWSYWFYPQTFVEGPDDRSYVKTYVTLDEAKLALIGVIERYKEKQATKDIPEEIYPALHSLGMFKSKP